jgi:hypothetical protein
MTTATRAPYRSSQQAGPDGFAQLLRAEWTKFRTVRGWIIGMIAAALVTLALGLFTVSASSSSCQRSGGGPAQTGLACAPTFPVGPGGEPVDDNFYFVHQPLAGNGSITVRVTSLTGLLPPVNANAPSGPGGPADTRPGLMPWAKAGIGVRGHDGHRRPRGTPAGQLHQRHGGPAGRRLRSVPALAAADPLR